MNIAHLLPTTAIFPLKKHNGRYEWALRLARAQVDAGHTVTIYAGQGSADSSSIVWQSISDSSDDKKIRNTALLTKALTQTAHDVYHSHFDYLHYLVADLTDKPIIVTQHWYPTQEIAQAVQFNKKMNVMNVPVTDMMKAEDNRLGIPSTHRIYHGIDLSLFTPALEHSHRFLFVGRIHPSKGIAEAIHYAKITGVPLDIIGKVNDTEATYWHSLASDVDGDHIRYYGSQPQTIVADAMAHAKALIFPSKPREPFGQVTIEAQATGTPVIISNVGASSELVRSGITGFICETDDDFIDAIEHIDTIDRAACRTNAEQFDFKSMVRDYESLYLSAI
jgi:glycosyltransferase involved in cell wall biosynthesis